MVGKVCIYLNNDRLLKQTNKEVGVIFRYLRGAKIVEDHKDPGRPFDFFIFITMGMDHWISDIFNLALVSTFKARIL